MGCAKCGQKNRAGSFQQREALRNQAILAAHKKSNGGTNVVGGATTAKVNDYTNELDRVRKQGS